MQTTIKPTTRIAPPVVTVTRLLEKVLLRTTLVPEGAAARVSDAEDLGFFFVLIETAEINTLSYN